MSLAQRLMQVFEGSSLGYLNTNVQGTNRKKGKTEAKYFVTREPLSEDRMQDHIDGKAGVGIIPIDAGNKCKFGVIDVDLYQYDYPALHKKIQHLKLPLFHCRSKSGGAHLYLFLDDWEDCAEVREMLQEMRSALGLAGSGELFPAQDFIDHENGDLGQGINIPYHEAETPQRFCYDENFEGMELEEFVAAVEKGRVSLSSLFELNFAGERSYFEDGPPCLRMIASMGAVGDNRNNFMFNVGVYCTLKYPEDWKEHLENYNRELCSPPLPASEILGLQGSLEKAFKKPNKTSNSNGYYYQCKTNPCCDYCNKIQCKLQKHGIGSNNVDNAEVTSLTIMQSDPRMYFMTVEGKTLTLFTEQLQNPTLWQKACMEQLDFMPPTPEKKVWQGLINELLQQAIKLEVPEELTKGGQFRGLIREFCASNIKALRREEMLTGRPWTEDDRTYFTIESVEQFLKLKEFVLNRPSIIKQIRDMGGDNTTLNYDNPEKPSGRDKLRCWWVPIQESLDYPVDEKEDKYDIPF